MNPLMPSGTDMQRTGTALSVNVNKIALLRNSRTLGVPSVVRAAALCLEAGAHGITVHPRPDERHIRRQDVFDLAELLKAWPGVEFNIEGNPFHNLIGLAREVVGRGLPLHQCTLVPDSVEQSTSDHGWRFPDDAARLAPVVAEFRALGVRVSLFMDPERDAMAAVRAVGADRVELYTETYARAFAEGRPGEVGQAFADAARAALREGLGVNAGHDLNLDNLPSFLSMVPGVQEVSIGHALVADALEFGLPEAVRRYCQCAREGNT
jgi:pyridoxine 5-phosphate synthase